MHETVDLLRNTASVAVWMAFNEGRGQFGGEVARCELAGLDPTRSVNHASG